jgi:hypothetical protein
MARMDGHESVHTEHHLQSRTCAWCGARMTYTGRGRPPRYCGKSCRNRAWEVRTTERRLQRDVALAAATTEPVREVIIETVTRTRTRVETRVDRHPPTTAGEWLKHLAELTRQLETGGQVAAQHWYHDRLYGALIDAVDALDGAYPGGLDRSAPARLPTR